MINTPLELYTNIRYDAIPGKSFLESIIENVQMAEHYNYKGTLVTYGNRSFDPWTVVNIIIQNTKVLTPLIAIQPLTMPPYTAAKMIQSLQSIFQRNVNLNYIVGVSGREMEELGDTISHDERYSRLAEYIEIVNCIIESKGPISYNGKYYKLNNYISKVENFQKSNIFHPEIFIAGSSQMSFQTALSYGDVMVSQPGPVAQYKEEISQLLEKKRLKLAVSFGIIARNNSKEAWDFARSLFPQSRRGTVETALRKSSQSQWVRNMADLALQQEVYDDVYWMGAFMSRTFNPYLVGSYEKVADYIMRYMDCGVNTVILNGPFTQEEFMHRERVFKYLQ